jgi:putative nucleotidyltransferase with HDIG domain
MNIDGGFMTEKKRILFVDDQPNILAGLRRMLHKMQDEWEMTFCESGKEALAAMEKQPFDLVVSDMMMPEMNGVQLLSKVSELYPGTIRFILSGYSDRELILQSAGSAHQYIAKPCDADELKQYLNSTTGLRQILTNPKLHARIASIRTLPSSPDIYNDVVHELQSETASIDVIANLISKDISLSAKLLQIVNSAFFGLPQHVGSVAKAVNYLGLNIVQGLVLTAGVYDQLNGADIPKASLEAIFNHSMAVGGHAKKIAVEIGLQQRDSEDALIAGLLHDIGKLVMLANFKDEMSAAIKLAQEKSIEPYLAEKEVLGASHGEIGAHLLSLWGLHDQILEAVAFHHNPQHTTQPTKNILTTVHIANAIDNCKPGDGDEFLSSLDTEYLEALDLMDQLPHLQECCMPQTV